MQRSVPSRELVVSVSISGRNIVIDEDFGHLEWVLFFSRREEEVNLLSSSSPNRSSSSRANLASSYGSSLLSRGGAGKIGASSLLAIGETAPVRGCQDPDWPTLDVPLTRPGELVMPLVLSCFSRPEVLVGTCVTSFQEMTTCSQRGIPLYLTAGGGMSALLQQQMVVGELYIRALRVLPKAGMSITAVGVRAAEPSTAGTAGIRRPLPMRGDTAPRRRAKPGAKYVVVLTLAATGLGGEGETSNNNNNSTIPHLYSTKTGGSATGSGNAKKMHPFLAVCREDLTAAAGLDSSTSSLISHRNNNNNNNALLVGAHDLTSFPAAVIGVGGGGGGGEDQITNIKVVAQTSVAKPSSHPIWAPLQVDDVTLCASNHMMPLLIQCRDHGKPGKKSNSKDSSSDEQHAIDVRVGTGDPSRPGILVGSVWATLDQLVKSYRQRRPIPFFPAGTGALVVHHIDFLPVERARGWSLWSAAGGGIGGDDGDGEDGDGDDADSARRRGAIDGGGSRGGGGLDADNSMAGMIIQPRLPKFTIVAQFSARGLIKPDTLRLGALDPYLVITREMANGSMYQVARTEVQNKTADPDWRAINCDDEEFCGGSRRMPIRISCYDHSKLHNFAGGKNSLIGFCTTTLEWLIAAFKNRSGIHLYAESSPAGLMSPQAKGGSVTGSRLLFGTASAATSSDVRGELHVVNLVMEPIDWGEEDEEEEQSQSNDSYIYNNNNTFDVDARNLQQGHRQYAQGGSSDNSSVVHPPYDASLDGSIIARGGGGVSSIVHPHAVSSPPQSVIGADVVWEDDRSRDVSNSGRLFRIRSEDDNVIVSRPVSTNLGPGVFVQQDGGMGPITWQWSNDGQPQNASYYVDEYGRQYQIQPQQPQQQVVHVVSPTIPVRREDQQQLQQQQHHQFQRPQQQQQPPMHSPSLSFPSFVDGSRSAHLPTYREEEQEEDPRSGRGKPQIALHLRPSFHPRRDERSPGRSHHVFSLEPQPAPPLFFSSPSSGVEEYSRISDRNSASPFLHDNSNSSRNISSRRSPSPPPPPTMAPPPLPSDSAGGGAAVFIAPQNFEEDRGFVGGGSSAPAPSFKRREDDEEWQRRKMKNPSSASSIGSSPSMVSFDSDHPPPPPPPQAVGSSQRRFTPPPPSLPTFAGSRKNVDETADRVSASRVFPSPISASIASSSDPREEEISTVRHVTIRGTEEGEEEVQQVRVAVQQQAAAAPPPTTDTRRYKYVSLLLSVLFGDGNPNKTSYLAIAGSNGQMVALSDPLPGKLPAWDHLDVERSLIDDGSGKSIFAITCCSRKMSENGDNAGRLEVRSASVNLDELQRAVETNGTIMLETRGSRDNSLVEGEAKLFVHEVSFSDVKKKDIIGSSSGGSGGGGGVSSRNASPLRGTDISHNRSIASSTSTTSTTTAGAHTHHHIIRHGDHHHHLIHHIHRDTGSGGGSSSSSVIHAPAATSPPRLSSSAASSSHRRREDEGRFFAPSSSFASPNDNRGERVPQRRQEEEEEEEQEENDRTFPSHRKSSSPTPPPPPPPRRARSSASPPRGRKAREDTEDSPPSRLDNVSNISSEFSKISVGYAGFPRLEAEPFGDDNEDNSTEEEEEERGRRGQRGRERERRRHSPTSRNRRNQNRNDEGEDFETMVQRAAEERFLESRRLEKLTASQAAAAAAGARRHSPSPSPPPPPPPARQRQRDEETRRGGGGAAVSSSSMSISQRVVQMFEERAGFASDKNRREEDKDEHDSFARGVSRSASPRNAGRSSSPSMSRHWSDISPKTKEKAEELGREEARRMSQREG